MIRSAVLDDADELASVHVRTWQAAYAHILPTGYLDALDPGERADGWRKRLGGRVPPTETFVAERDDRIIGFASVGSFRFESESKPSLEIAEVYAIYVHPDHWSTGAGRDLMTSGVTHLAEAGFREIRLWVFEANERARRFYQRAGFTFDGTTAVDTTDRGGAYETSATELRYTLVV